MTWQSRELIYKDADLQVFKTSFKGNLVDHAHSLADNKPFVFLDSAGAPSKLNRWSFLACQPLSSQFSVLSSQSSIDPFNQLRDFFNENKREEWQNLDFSPYMGGPIGYASYDAVRYIEKLPNLATDDLKLPDFYFINPTQVYAHNHKTNELFIYMYGNNVATNDVAEAFRLPNDVVQAFRLPNKFTPNMTKEEFEKAVNKIREHIYAGDVYQVNFSQRFEADFNGSSWALYQKLREVNPAPFCAFLQGNDFELLSSSPERLVSLDKTGRSQTRPIAGTRRRGSDIKEDEYLSGNLLLDNKERAEHIMLVDLERNDLGKVSDYGSVAVDEMMTIEKYAHVIHIVSNVVGKLHKNKDEIDLLKAMFPGGTITGCPKVRCMQIIEELEPTRRAAYTGSLGYLSYNGNIDFNILIRTIVQKANKVYVQAGAGIVADSVPRREYFETISKAQALFKSLGHDFKEVQWEQMFT